MKQNTRLEVPAVKAGQATQVGMLVEVTAPKLSQSNIQRKSQGVIFVVDRSGSMGGGRLDLVKNTISELIGRLAPEDHLAIISFDNQIEVHQPMSPVGQISAQAIRRALSTLDPRGGTNMEIGIKAGLEEARKLPSGVEARLILLSDGQANEGAHSPEQLGQLAAAATEHLVKVSSIGIGTGYNEQVMSHIASAGQGNHFAAVELAEAVTGLQDEIDGLLQRSLEHISCEIKVEGAEVRILPLGYTRGVRSIPGGQIVELGDLASGETRGYAFMLEVPALPEGAPVIVVKTDVRALQLENGEAVGEEMSVQIEIQPAAGFIKPAKDEDVTAEVIAYRLAEIKRQARDAAFGGDFVFAKSIIDQAKAEIVFMLATFVHLSPRVRARIEAENQELEELLQMEQAHFSKRATESMFRTNISKQDPRKKGQ